MKNFFVFKMKPKFASLSFFISALCGSVCVSHSVMSDSTQVRSLGWEDPLEKEMATHFSILAWEI